MFFSETDYDKQWDEMEGLKSSTLESCSREGKEEVKEEKEEKEVKEVEKGLGDNNNCLPPAVTMDEMELLKKLEEANRYILKDVEFMSRGWL